MSYYTNPIKVGLDAVASLGDGYSINIKWFQAYPSNINNNIAYHIYFSTVKENVYIEGVKFVSIDDSTVANIIDLIPGQEYFFSVRPVEYNPTLYDLDAILPIAYDNLRIYPNTLLRDYISETDLIIPLLDVEGFPSTGIVKIGVELIQYLAVDQFNNNLVLTDISQRGFLNSKIREHYPDGYDGYYDQDPRATLFAGGESTQFDRIFICQSRFEYPCNAFTMADGYYQVLQDTLTTDLTASDESNIDFPMYDYAGYHRTDPVLLLSGACVGSYIGGEQGCIDGYGNVQIVRGFSLQDQNNQRQEVLLNTTGRPVVLAQKVRTGIVCSCYQPSSEYPDDRCPYCFVPGTLINTKNGFIPIENINVGDMVLGSDGEFHKVLNTFKSKYEGKLKAITTTTTTSPILCTPNHPFLVLGGSHNNPKGCGPNSCCKEFIKRGDGKRSSNGIKQLPNGRWHARAQAINHKRSSLGTFDTKNEAKLAIDSYFKEHHLPGHTITWTDASNLNKNNWLVNKWYRHIVDIKTIEIPKQFQKNTKLGIKRNGVNIFEVDNEFLWIIGLYIAEGSNNKRSIQFALHKDEIIYQDRIKKYFENKGFNISLVQGSENGVSVVVYSTSLAQWFPNWLGHLCHNKKIPNEFMYLPDDKSLSLLQGIFDGDASKRDEDLIQTSEILALQVGEILHRLGKQPNLRQKINKTLTLKGNKRKVAYGVSKELSSFNRKNRKGRWQFNENLLTKIKKVEETDYNGFVYNLEIEGDHTYVVQNIIVHNCYGTKYVFGYQQYFNPRRSDGRILVRPGPTEETLKMYEAGMESEFPLSLWTLTVPTINPRDVIIMFDQDDNEEFRYEVINVTRNNTIVGLQGGQHFKVMRIRKTDPAYQIRVFRNTSEFPSKLNTTIGFVPGIPPHAHEIVISEKILTINQINQTTAISQAHNHPIVNGQVMPVLGHAHNIVLP